MKNKEIEKETLNNEGKPLTILNVQNAQLHWQQLPTQQQLDFQQNER